MAMAGIGEHAIKLYGELIQWLGSVIELPESVNGVVRSLEITLDCQVGFACVQGQRYTFGVCVEKSKAFAGIIKRWGHFQDDAEIRKCSLCVKPDSLLTITAEVELCVQTPTEKGDE